MIYVNQVGGQDDLVFDGGTFVVDTDGTLLQRSPMFMEDLAYFTLDTDREHQEVCEVAPRMDPDEEVYTACVLGLKDYMAKNGFTGVCLGLSGGIDSALVAAMAADAVGGGNVYGISMPSMYSSQGSKDDAADLAANIGAHYDVQPIKPMYDAFQQQLALDGVSAENLQARIRGVIVIRRSTVTRWAATRRSKTCSRPRSGSWRAGATARPPRAWASVDCTSSATRQETPVCSCPAV